MTVGTTLEDKIAIVTGGGQGLGQAISYRLAHEGCHVVVTDLNGQAAIETAETIVKNEAETKRCAIALKVDVTDEKQVSDMVDRTVREFGRLDILVSNAGILIAEAVEDFPADKW